MYQKISIAFFKVLEKKRKACNKNFNIRRVSEQARHVMKLSFTIWMEDPQVISCKHSSDWILVEFITFIKPGTLKHWLIYVCKMLRTVIKCVFLLKLLFVIIVKDKLHSHFFRSIWSLKMNNFSTALLFYS